jgi:hypothetical protein
MVDYARLSILGKVAGGRVGLGLTVSREALGMTERVSGSLKHLGIDRKAMRDAIGRTAALTGPDDTDLSVGDYEVAIAIAPAAWAAQGIPSPAEADDSARPGFDDTSGFRSGGRHAAARSSLLAKGDAAVKLATEAIARQIGLAAQRIAETIDAQAMTPQAAGILSLESVEVSFGVTLTVGVEALFTAKSESSAEVTIILSRRPGE